MNAENICFGDLKSFITVYKAWKETKRTVWEYRLFCISEFQIIVNYLMEELIKCGLIGRHDMHMDKANLNSNGVNGDIS
jgi:hypothetical protein